MSEANFPERRARVQLAGTDRFIDANAGDNLLQVLRGAGERIAAPCGGRGTCGKCLVRIDGASVLACNTIVQSDMQVEILGSEDDFEVLESHAGGERTAPAAARSGLRVAVDIGTTTVVAQLLDGGEVRAVRSFLNGQRAYGADVITRIKYAGEGGLDTLSDAITSQLSAAVQELLAEARRGPDELEAVYIAGNTTMMYLLLRLRCASLGAYPFKPEFPLEPQYGYRRIFGDKDGFPACPVYLLPWVSAFVGGDITAGYLYCRKKAGERALLIDMGTNGEMLLWAGDRLWSCSTAAGPAFEGGGITHGVGSIRGAICKVDHLDGKFVAETIGGAPPLGICGSGVLDAGACLLQSGCIDENGLLGDDYFDDGVVIAYDEQGNPISFTQKDVRELQLAKSAVRAGVEILLIEAGMTADDLDAVYLAGGFGQKLRLESAAAIGLLPRALADKAVACGNSSLGGCALACTQPALLDEARRIAAVTAEINLSAHPKFNDFFMDYMLFE